MGKTAFSLSRSPHSGAASALSCLRYDPVFSQRLVQAATPQVRLADAHLSAMTLPVNAVCAASAGQDIGGTISLSGIHNPAAMLKGRCWLVLHPSLPIPQSTGACSTACSTALDPESTIIVRICKRAVLGMGRCADSIVCRDRRPGHAALRARRALVRRRQHRRPLRVRPLLRLRSRPGPLVVRHAHMGVLRTL